VFAQEARMVVLVYRDGWGERGFTYIEQTAIKRRIHAHGADFLFIVIAATEPPPTLPDWLPADHVYWELPTFGIDDAVDAIRQRLRRLPSVPTVETAVDLALRQQRERIARSRRDAFRRSSKASECARAELRNVFDAVDAIAKKTNGSVPRPTWHNDNLAIVVRTDDGGPRLTFEVQPVVGRPTSDPDLFVRVWRGLGSVLGTFGRDSGMTWSHAADYVIDIDESDNLGWSVARTRATSRLDSSMLSSNEVAERGVKEWLTRRRH
jgi:hypothetical protein